MSELVPVKTSTAVLINTHKMYYQYHTSISHVTTKTTDWSAVINKKTRPNQYVDMFQRLNTTLKSEIKTACPCLSLPPVSITTNEP